MKKILSLITPLTVCAFGGVIVLLGELWGALWDGGKAGGTISEWYKGLPEWVKLLLAGIYIGVFVHLIEWRIRDSEDTKKT